MPPTVKKCAHCEQVKGVGSFNKATGAKDGLQSWCKECSKAYNAKHYGRRTRKKNGDNPVSVIFIGGKMRHLLAFCAQSDGVTVDHYCQEVLRRHLRDHVLDDLINL